MRSENLMKSFRDAVKRSMKRNKITMSELSRQADVNRSHLYALLSGARSPTLEMVERIAKPTNIKVTFREQHP